jgi:hypothetical protein
MPPPTPANQRRAQPHPDLRPTAAELAFLRRGLDQPGGKLPLFDTNGQAYPHALIRACIRKGWAAPWFANPMKPDWLVCRLTDAGRSIAGGDASEKGPARR